MIDRTATHRTATRRSAGLRRGLAGLVLAGLVLPGLLFLPLPVLAAPAGDAPVPLPPERPAELAPATPPGPAIEAPPAPPGRPADLAPAAVPSAGQTEIPVPPPTPPERPPELAGEAALALRVAPPDDTACRVRLARLGVAFTPLPPIVDGQCGQPLPLRVTALGDGVALPTGATLGCAAAEALARWATEVQAAAERELKAPLKGIELAGSYECRGQNHGTEARLSEHAFANAVDVTGFRFEGRPPVKVAPASDDGPEGRFLAAARARACPMFRTVLGPGSTAEHADHLHLDERERNAGHRLCQ